MKKTITFLEKLSQKDKEIFLEVCEFLNQNLVEDFKRILLQKFSGVSEKRLFLTENEKSDVLFKITKEVRQKNVILYNEIASFLIGEKSLFEKVFGAWAVQVDNNRNSPLVLTEILRNNFNVIPLDVCFAIYMRASALSFIDGSLSENYKIFNDLYCKIVTRSKPVELLDTPKKEYSPRVYIFVAQVIWDSKKHAPSLIVKNWVNLLSPIFGKINIIVSPPEEYYLPLSSNSVGFVNSFPQKGWFPQDGDLNCNFFSLSLLSTQSDIKNILGDLYPTKKDILLCVGENVTLFDRMKGDRKFLWPTCQYPFLHSANYVFSFNHQDMLSQKNIYDSQVKFLPVSTGGFIDLSEDDAILPLDRFKRKTDFNSVNLVAIGNRLMLEMDQKFFQIIESISKNYKVKLTCVGIESFCFPEIKNVSFECVGFQNNLESYVRESDFDFFINPRRSGGGFGAVVSLVSGIPTLTLPYGDIFQIMKNFYYMNDEKDFSVFINSFMTDPSFREAINNLHLAMKEISENVNNDPSFLPLNRMLNALEI